jgi:hypothetical protein
VFNYNFTTFADAKKRSSGRVARQRSAKPSTAVRIRSRPQKTVFKKLILRKWQLQD